MRAVILALCLLALAACAGTTVDGRASSHGPDHVVVGFPF
jgi:hypothetical protein